MGNEEKPQWVNFMASLNRPAKTNQQNTQTLFMKRKWITLLAAFYTLLLSVGCNNDANKTNETTAKDTVLNKDSVNVDPKNFSDPH